ncbi:MAG: hypothetical protein R3F60_26125 [bacterium]
MLRALPLLILAAPLACGSPPIAPRATRLDVLHQVYLRGLPGSVVGLSFDGLGPCLPDLLARLKAPADELPALRATFFIEAGELDEPDAPLQRLLAEGHEVALRVAAPPAAWIAAPEALRQGLTEAARALADGLAERKLVAAVPRFWRAGGAPDPLALGRAADAERPLVLWSVYGEGRTPADLASAVIPRLAGGEIVALPTSQAGCPAVELVPLLARALQERHLTAAPVSAVLGERLERHHPPQLVRYLGPGLPGACATPLGVPGGADAGEKPRWGLVIAELPDAVQVLPLGGDGQATADVLAGPALALWAKRPTWLGMPGCARRVALDRLLPPVTATGPGGRVQWWVVDELGTSQRDARSAGPPGSPTGLPATADLVRIEARQRLGWVLRGLVASALERLGLETPLLVEARSSAAVVLARPLAPGAGPAEVEAAIGGFVQVVELSLAEYLYLAARSPVDLPALLRLARAADGFLRPGPFLVLRRDGLPDGRTLGPDGAGFAEPPAALVARVLATGATLAPGDVVAAAGAPLLGAPEADAPPDRLSRRARLRHGLARSILSGAGRSGYLRAGAMVRVDGDLLGRQLVRVVSPAGVAVPSGDAIPIRPVSPWGAP